MADNVNVDPGTGGSAVPCATDDVGGIHYQKVKLALGAENAVDVVVDSGQQLMAASLPVVLASDHSDVKVTLDSEAVELGATTLAALETIELGATSLAALETITVAALPAGTNNIGDVDVLTVPADPFGANADAASAAGSISAKLRFIASTGIPITGSVTVAAHAVTNAGTFAVQVDGNALTALQLIDDAVYVDDADWTDNTSKHLLVGGVYQSSPHTVTDGDVSPFLTDVNGRLAVAVSGTVTVNGSGVTQPISHAALTELAAAIDTEVQCDIVGALPAGTNNIGDVDIASALPAGTNNIGDVDVLSVVPGTAATNLGKAEDAAHSSGDVGVMAMTVRQDTAAALGGTDADYQPLITDGSGRLHVNVGNTVTVASHAVTNAGTFAVQVDGSVLTALQLIDNIVHVDDAAYTLGTHSGVMMMGFAGTQSVDANDAAALACSTAGALHVSDAGGSLTVDNGGTFAVQVSSIAAGNNNIGDVDIVTLPNVTLAAGTNTNEVVGDAAHGAAAAGNPLLNGLEGRSTAPTAVDDGDVVRALATLLGKQVVYPFALPASSWSYASAAAVTDTADDEAKAAVASTRSYVTGVQVFNGHDTVGTEVVIKDGSTVLWRGWAEQTGGGCSAVFTPPLRGTANTAVNVANITNASSTYFNLQGFVATE